MGILKWLKSFNRSHSKTRALASVLDYFPIPKRTEFQSDQEMLSLIDQYKSSYLEKIRTKEIYYSGDIAAKNIRDKMEMYTSLLFRIINNSENMDFSFDKVDDWNKEEARALDYKIKTSKLGLYLQRLVVIRKDVQAHMVALDEILSENRFIFPRKRRAISGELNNLVGNFIAVSNQVLASEKEKEAFTKRLLAKIEEDTLKSILLDEATHNEMQSRIEAYHRDLMDMIREVLPEKERFLKDANITNIVMIEFLFEEYVYKNSDKVEELFKELEELKRKVKEKCVSKADIYSLEMKFKVFALYGDHLITRDDLFELYKLKFRIYTDELKINDDPIVENASMIEVECYEEIVSRQINWIMLGSFRSFSRIQLPKEQTILEIKKTLKNKEGEFSPWYILSDNYRLLFLLAFDDNINKMSEILSLNDNPEKYYDFIKDENLPNPEHLFSYFESEVPLETIFYIIFLLKNNDSGKASIEKLGKNNPLFKLYTLYIVGITDNPNIPFDEMLRGFKYSDVKNEWDIGSFKKLLGRKWKDKQVIFPVNIHVFDTNFFDKMTFKSIKLQEGLDIIKKGFNGIWCENIVIPSSLKIISPGAFKGAIVNTITFNYFQISCLTKDSFINLLKSLSYGSIILIFAMRDRIVAVGLFIAESYVVMNSEESLRICYMYSELDQLYDDIISYIEKQCTSHEVDAKSLTPKKEDTL